ncbi:MAG: inorganic phosphate transporter [Bacteroidales bacterium]|nr:inorganic phosphate transporter [Bacteroidales bacterium]
MELYYQILIGILIVFAVFDLVVGVGNDAVNFLNSAIGSKSASFWAIMAVASLGILVGATFASGMMEVAKKGIFDPSQFYFSEVMIIFVAVMITDIILLDTFNTLGLPTSTTVSIVFELLGGAVAIAFIKIMNSDQEYSRLAEFINTEKVLLIISGILLSVVLSFGLGSLVQWISRLIFSFKFEKSIKYGGSLFGGISITAITFFLLIKGVKGASFMTDDVKDYIHTHSFTIILGSFAFWTIFLQLFHWLFKLNILKFTVLTGTFALAMAFAGNDLVNFIGVPLAGVDAYNEFAANGMNESVPMVGLNNHVVTPTMFLLLAGLVMVLTLWFSKKAKKVTATSLNLSSQNENTEQFGSSAISRSIVRGTLKLGNSIDSILPDRARRFIEKRFEQSAQSLQKTGASFDMIRATVNLLVASVLIAIGTSFKLPLSTTYVTFMVAMGTSFADGAWGRESAVYRITGVLTVISGWFLTAFIAFAVCAIVAILISIGGAYVIGIFLLIIFYAAIKSFFTNSKKAKVKELEDAKFLENSNLDIKTRCEYNVTNTLTEVSELLQITLDSLCKEDRRMLRASNKRIVELNLEVKEFKDKLSSTLKQMNMITVETGHFYVQIIDYLREAAHCLTYINTPAFEHVNNNHKPLHVQQILELEELKTKLANLISTVINEITERNYSKLGMIIESQAEIIELIGNTRKKQIKRIKKSEVNTRNGMLYMSLLHELKTVSLYIINILKSHRDFINAGIAEHEEKL